MPPGRKPNHDSKINRLVAELRKALVARETSKIESTVSSHVDTLVRNLSRGASGDASESGVVEATAASGKGRGGARATAAVGKRAKAGGRKPRSAASRALQAAKMKAYWAKRRAGEGKGADAKKAKDAK